LEQLWVTNSKLLATPDVPLLGSIQQATAAFTADFQNILAADSVGFTRFQEVMTAA